MNDPKISIVCSVYNEEKLIKKSLNSILKQSFKDFEYIIINDCSTDSTLDILKKFKNNDDRIIIINNEKNIGLTKSLNKGLKIAKGKYIARMDADDIADPDRLKKQYEFLEKNPKIVACGSWAVYIDENDKIIRKQNFPTTYEDIKSVIIEKNTFTHSSLMIRKKVLDEIGFYDEKYAMAQDYNLLLRMIAKYPVVNMPQYLIYYRKNREGVSFQKIKTSLIFSLKARWEALVKYNYPKKFIFTFIKVLFFYSAYLLIPSKKIRHFILMKR